MTGNDILYLVIPCYNEEAVLHEFGKSSLLFKELENECSKYMGMQEEVLDGNRAR
mgnify:CR=1 FL=1